MISLQARALRGARGWSAQRLAEEMTSVGVPWDRSVVANLENGRRRAVSVDEWLALAMVLGVAPIHLLVPIDTTGEYQITPNLAADLKTAREWIRGNWPYPNKPLRPFHELTAEDQDVTASRPLLTYLAHLPPGEAQGVFESVPTLRGMQEQIQGVLDLKADLEKQVGTMQREVEHLRRTALDSAGATDHVPPAEGGSDGQHQEAP